MNPQILSRPRLRLAWVTIAIAMYYILCLIFGLIDHFLYICTYTDMVWTSEVSCPALFSWYSIGFNSVANLIGLFLVPTVFLILWIVSIIFFKKEQQLIEVDVSMLSDADIKRKQVSLFKFCLYWLPVLFAGLVFISEMVLSALNLEEHDKAKHMYKQYMTSDQKVADDIRYKAIASQREDRCPVDSTMYITSNDGHTRGVYLHIPKDLFAELVYLVISHENEWDGTFPTQEGMFIAEKYNPQYQPYGDLDYTAELVNTTALEKYVFVPGRTFDVRALVHPDPSSTFVPTEDGFWRHYRPVDRGSFESTPVVFNRTFKNGAACVTVTMR